MTRTRKKVDPYRVFAYVKDYILGTNKISRKARNHLAGVAMLGSLILTALVFAKAHRETRHLNMERGVKVEAIEAMLDSEEFGYAIMDQSGKIIEWNPALERITGWTQEEVKQNGLETLMVPKMAEDHKKAVYRSMSGMLVPGKVISILCEIPSPVEGEPPIPVKVSVRTVKAHNGERYAIAHVDLQKSVKVFDYAPQRKENSDGKE
jgi:PAS domain S-box-containing protein